MRYRTHYVCYVFTRRCYATASKSGDSFASHTSARGHLSHNNLRVGLTGPTCRVWGLVWGGTLNLGGGGELRRPRHNYTKTGIKENDLVTWIGLNYSPHRTLWSNAYIPASYSGDSAFSSRLGDRSSLQVYHVFPQSLQANAWIVFFIIGGVGLTVPRYCGHFWPILQTPDDR
jgi:hypothetical protein